MTNEQTDYRAKVTQMLDGEHHCMFTTITAEGVLVSRPMALQEIEFDGDLWFFAFEDSNKVMQISSNPQVNVSIDKSGNNWLSLSGTAHIVHDRSKAEELWSPLLSAWFKDGLDTEGLTLIKVSAASAEYWDAPNSKVVQLFGMVKAAVTGNTVKSGDNKSVDL